MVKCCICPFGDVGLRYPVRGYACKATPARVTSRSLLLGWRWYALLNSQLRYYVLKQVARMSPFGFVRFKRKTRSFPSPEGSAYNSPESWWLFNR